MKCAAIAPVACVWLAMALGVGASDWRRIGPDAAMVTALVAHPSDPEIALAGTDEAGIFRTQDGGDSWSHTGLRGLGITVFEFSAVNPDRVYAGLTRWPMDREPGGVFVSDDGGLSWAAARTGLEADWCPPGSPCPYYMQIIDLAIDPTDSSTVWAATDYGLFTTTDSGNSWSRVPHFGGYGVWSVTVTSGEAHVVFVSWPHYGVVKSEDGGVTWSSASAGLEYFHHTGREELHSPYDLVEAPWSAGMLFGRVNADRLFRYDPSDQTWSQVEALDALPSRGAYQDRWLTGVVPGPSGSSDLWLGTFWSGVIRSNDGGESWAYTDSIGIDCTDTYNLESFLVIPELAVFEGSGGRLIAGTTIGNIVRSLDGGATWYSASEGLSNSYPGSLVIDETVPEHMVVGTRGQGLFFTADGGDDWAEVLSHELSPCDFDGPNPWCPGLPDCWSWGEIRKAPRGELMVEGGCGIHVSVDRGANWQRAGEFDHWPLGHSSDDQLWYVKDFHGQVLRGDGQDANWQACGELPSAPYPDGLFRAVVFHDLEPEVALAGRNGDLFRTEDGCESWTQTGEAFAECRIYWLGADPDRPGRYLVSTRCGLWESTDHALTWELIGFQETVAYDILFDPVRTDIVYAGTGQSGVLFSTDRGESWHPLGRGVSGSAVGRLALESDGSALYASVHGDGVYRLNLGAQFGWVREYQDSAE